MIQSECVESCFLRADLSLALSPSYTLTYLHSCLCTGDAHFVVDVERVPHMLQNVREST